MARFGRTTTTKAVIRNVIALLAVFLFSAVAAAQQVTVTVAHTWHEPFATRIEAFDKAFMERHPDIRIERIAGKSSDELLTAFVGGAAPDVFVGVNKTLIENGVMTDLRPFLERTPEFDFADYAQIAYSAWVRDGAIYGLPYDVGAVAVYYRPSLFAQAGMAEPDFNWTNEDMLDVARKLTRIDGASGEVQRYGIGGYWLWWLNAPMLAGFGARYYDMESGEVLSPPDKAADALRWWSALNLEWNVGDPMAWNLGEDLTAMSFQGTWAFEEWVDKDLFDGDVSIAPVPAGPEGRYTTLGGNAYGISVSSNVKDAAWVYLSEFLSAAALASYNLPELEGHNWIFSSSSPPRMSLLVDVGRSSGSRGDLLRAILSDALATSGMYAPFNFLDGSVTSAIDQHLGRVVTGEVDANSAVELARAQAHALLQAP